MTNEQLLTIIASIAGLVLTSTIAIVALIQSQMRVIRSELREAARERIDIRDRIGRVEASLGERMGRIEGRLDELREFFFRTGGTAA